MISITAAVIGEQMRLICRGLAQEDFMEDYYLAGGTALALQLQHRRSVDLDFFTSKKSNFDHMERLLESFPKTGLEIVFRTNDQLDIKINTVKTSFVFYPFPVLNSLIDGNSVESGFSGLKIASAREIALMKAYALGRRTSFRDYIDLYYLLKQGLISLEEIIRDCNEKYILEGERVFSGKLFLQQLAYTDDINDKDVSLSYLFEQGIDNETISAFLKEKVSEYLKTNQCGN